VTCDVLNLRRASGSSRGPVHAGVAGSVWRPKPLEELEKELSGLKVMRVVTCDV
jgi:hypothetical protein